MSPLGGSALPFSWKKTIDTWNGIVSEKETTIQLFELGIELSIIGIQIAKTCLFFGSFKIPLFSWVKWKHFQFQSIGQWTINPKANKIPKTPKTSFRTNTKIRNMCFSKSLKMRVSLQFILKIATLIIGFQIKLSKNFLMTTDFDIDTRMSFEYRNS